MEILSNKMLNNYLISMHMIQTTLEDIQKWWGIIVTEINIIQDIFQNSNSLLARSYSVAMQLAICNSLEIA